MSWWNPVAKRSPGLGFSKLEVVFSMISMDNDEKRQIEEAEIAARRDEIVRKMIATPPQPKLKPAPESKRGLPKKPNP